MILSPEHLGSKHAKHQVLIPLWCTICQRWLVRVNKPVGNGRVYAIHMNRQRSVEVQGMRACTARLEDFRVHLDREEVIAAFMIGGQEALDAFPAPTEPGVSFLGSK